MDGKKPEILCTSGNNNSHLGLISVKFVETMSAFRSVLKKNYPPGLIFNLLWSYTNLFVGSIEFALEKCTNDMLVTPDWGAIMEAVDKINGTPILEYTP